MWAGPIRQVYFESDLDSGLFGTGGWAGEWGTRIKPEPPAVPARFPVLAVADDTASVGATWYQGWAEDPYTADDSSRPITQFRQEQLEAPMWWCNGRRRLRSIRSQPGGRDESLVYR